MKLKKERSVKRKIFLSLGIFFFFFSFLISFFFYLTRDISSLFLSISETEVKKISATVINNAITDDVINRFKDMELYEIATNNNNEIEMIDYNSFLVNIFLRSITSNIQNDLTLISKGDLTRVGKEKNEKAIIYYIPFGIILGNPFFNQMGPKIPVKVDYIGFVLTNIKTEVKDYGINNALIEMSIHVEITARVILPVLSKEILVTNDIPISYKIIKGNIPQFYNSSGFSKSSNILSVPLDE